MNKFIINKIIMCEKGKLTEKTDAEALNEFLKSIPYGEYKATKERLAEACKVPTYTFNNWCYGLAKIPELCKEKIEEVSGVEIFKN